MNLHFRKKPLAMVVAGLAIGAAASGQAWALTPAGTEINNRATVTYEDENGNEYSAQSNESTVTVAEQYAATIEDDNVKPGAPGSTVYFPHVLTNTGNVTDTYDVSSLDDNDSAIEYTVYEDINNNGLPDAGEPEVTDITLEAGEKANLVVAVTVPSNLTEGDTVEATLTTTSQNGDAGTVEDVGDNGDGQDETNQDVVEVSEGAVLAPTKSADVDYDNNQITYTLQLANNGSVAASDVVILDAIPEGATFVDGSVQLNGLLTGTDLYDTATITDPATIETITINEPAGVDLNGNGIDGEVDIVGLSFTDVELPRDTTVSVEFTVDFDPTVLSAGDEINNRFVAGEDENGDGVPNDPERSNETTTVIEPIYGTIARDTGEDDGTDDDGDLNDRATVDEAAAGSTVAFTNIIENTGNTTDTFDLTIENGVANYSGSADTNGLNPFPPGTTFQFWNATNNTQLTDTNGNGIPDTGSVARDTEVQITVRAKLPADASGTGPFGATMTSTSGGDETVSDDKLEVLGEITAPNIDLANTFDADLRNTAVDKDAYDYTGSDVATLNTDDTEVTGDAKVGGTVTFPLFAANNSGNSDSFVLDADLPDGWNVTFREVGVIGADETAELSTEPGATVSSTPLLPAGAVYQYVAEVDISSVTDQALADFLDENGDPGTIDTLAGDPQAATQAGLDANGDGDIDYPVVFTIESTATGATDAVLDAVDVDSEREIAVTPDGANQVQPGGSVDYSHVIANRGNTTEELELTTDNTKGDEGWDNNTQVFNVDEGEWVNIENIPDGDVTLRSPDGEPVDVTKGESNGNPTLTLDPEERVAVKTTVFAPAGASQGDVDDYTLTATTTDEELSGVATDTTQVVTGQVRLEKTAYVDPADASEVCGCTTDMPYDTATTTFEAEPTDKPEPGDCVVWNLEARNEGTTVAQNVTINDTVTEFTTLEGTPADASDGTVATEDAGDVEWAIGELAAGETVNAQFCVRVD